MMNRPCIGAKYRSCLSGRTVRVKDNTMHDILVLSTENGTQHVHIRDFNAEYRLVSQQRHVNTGPR